MGFPSWLRNLTSRSQHPQARRTAARKPARPALRLEQLEDRCLLSGGVLDPTFGTGGVVTTSIGSFSTTTAVATYPNAGTANDGKIVAVGYGSYPAEFIRYNLDGTLDHSFGSSGLVTNKIQQVNDVKVQPDGKIVAAGPVYDRHGNSHFAVVRYNADGSLDTSFGGTAGKGEVITGINQNSSDVAKRLALQPDGKIVVSGWTRGSSAYYDLALVRYNADGSLDATFGTGGKVIQHFAHPLLPGTWAMDMAIDRGVNALDPNAGKIVVVDTFQIVDEKVVMRFNTNGSLDTSFGGGAGYVTFSPGTFTSVYVAVQLDDRIVVAAAFSSLARLNPDGTPDVTFGPGGITPLPSSENARSVMIQPDGKILVAGSSITDGNFVVARYNATDGSLDSSFGVNGVAVSTGVGSGGAPVDVVLEPDGRIVVAGSNNTGLGISSFAVARFLAAGPQIGSFTASPNPVTAGSSMTLTASNITDLNPNSTITQVAFYYFDSNGNKVTLGTGTPTSGVWTLTFSTAGLTSGTYRLFAQAKDNYGVFGDPLASTETVS